MGLATLHNTNEAMEIGTRKDGWNQGQGTPPAMDGENRTMWIFEPCIVTCLRVLHSVSRPLCVIIAPSCTIFGRPATKSGVASDITWKFCVASLGLQANAFGTPRPFGSYGRAFAFAQGWPLFFHFSRCGRLAPSAFAPASPFPLAVSFPSGSFWVSAAPWLAFRCPRCLAAAFSAPPL